MLIYAGGYYKGYDLTIGVVKVFIFDEAGNELHQFNIERDSDPLISSTFEGVIPNYPISLAPDKNGWVYVVTQKMERTVYDESGSHVELIFPRRVYRYDRNGFRRALSVDCENPYVVACDSSDSVYVGCETDYEKSTTTYNDYLIAVDSSGTELWRKTATDPPYYSAGPLALAWISYFAANPTLNKKYVQTIDIKEDSGSIYVYTTKYIEKLNSSGVQQWRRWIFGSSRYGNIVIVGGYLFMTYGIDTYMEDDGITPVNLEYGYDYAITKWSLSDGSYLGYLGTSAHIYIKTGDGYIHGTTGDTYYKIDTDLVVLTSIANGTGKDFTESQFRFAISAASKMYSVVRLEAPNKFYVSTPPTIATTTEFSDDDLPSHTITMTAFAAIEGERLPQLPITFRFGEPTIIGDRYTVAPGLPLALALKAPRGIIEFTGIRPPIVYRATLTDGVSVVEVAIESISCRYTADGIDLSVVAPSASLALVSSIDALGDSILIVQYGYRVTTTAIAWAELVRADFTGSRFDQGAGSASLTLTAGGDAEFYYTTRTLRGISYRSINNGLRSVRCDVDPYLRPGDTADLGAGETMIVDSVTYALSTSAGTMTVDEALAV